MTLNPVPVDRDSPFIGESCALCKEPFQAGDSIIVCPEDAVRHHRDCWVANGNRCTAYGCTGAGAVGPPERPGRSGRRGRRAPQPTVTIIPDERGRPASRVKALPERSVSWARSCLILAIALAIILVAVGCFGLWAILDYILMEILGWRYRDPVSVLPWATALTAAHLWWLTARPS